MKGNNMMVRMGYIGYKTGHVSVNVTKECPKLLKCQTKPSSRQALYCQHTMFHNKPKIYITSIIYYIKHQKYSILDIFSINKSKGGIRLSHTVNFFLCSEY